MLRTAFALLAAHFLCGSALAAPPAASPAASPAGKCRLGFVPVKTDYVKSATSQGISEVRGQGLSYESHLRGFDKANQSFFISLSSTDLNRLSLLTRASFVTHYPAICARVDPSSYNASTKLVPWSSLTARYGNYEVDAGQPFPR